MNQNKRNNLSYVLLLVSVFLYFTTAYFLERSDFTILVTSWTILFVCFYFIVQNKQFDFKFLVGVSIVFKLIFLFSTPNLSQDFYRFIWDGRMLLEGFNPYLSLPQTFIEQHNLPIEQATELYQGMGEFNGSNYTNYPPINQLSFLIAALFANSSIVGSAIVMRITLILADIGIILYGSKILEKLNISTRNIFWYALNPFIIIELTGNLHYEPLMLFFLVLSIYKLQQQKWIWAAIFLALSISVKLIPLLFLPLFYQWFIKPKKENEISGRIHSIPYNFLKLSAFYGVVILTTLLLFLPFYSSGFISNYSNSVGLWFKNFEFNASIYYLFREIGYSFRGWNEIAIIGKIMPILTMLFLLVITFFRKNTSIKQLITAMLFGLSFYYFTTTTVHPWYIASLVLLSSFTNYRFPILWSFVIILSYYAYSNEVVEENLLLISLEYIVVYGFMTWEIISQKKPYSDAQYSHEVL